MEHKRIKLSKLVQNNGQIEGVPKNPRQWTKDDVERLKQSIEETPELLEARVEVRDSIIYRDRQTTKIVEVERELTWWQRFRLDAFWALLALVVVIVGRRFVK